jgi:chloramphenicol 3-O-phosphotransferase
MRSLHTVRLPGQRCNDARSLRLRHAPSPCSHPGGRSVLLNLAGRDGTAAFNNAHNHVTPEQWIPVRGSFLR